MIANMTHCIHLKSENYSGKYQIPFRLLYLLYWILCSRKVILCCT